MKKNVISFLILMCCISLLSSNNVEASQHEKVVIPSQNKSIHQHRVTIVYPKGYNKKEALPILFTLPPGPGNFQMVNANLARWESEANLRNYIIVAPEVFGLSLKNNAKIFTEEIFQWMDTNLPFDSDRVFLVGQSNGGVGAFYVYMASPDRFKAMIVLPGVYQGDESQFKRLKGKSVWMLVGDQDPSWKKFSEITKQSLESVGVKVKFDILPNQQHVLTYPSKKFFDWFEQQK